MMGPDEMGGVPTVMPRNDWWDFAGKALDIVAERQRLKLIPAQGGPISSNVRNFPPNAGGSMPQAMSVPGAALPESLRALDMRVIVAGAAALAVVLILVLVSRGS